MRVLRASCSNTQVIFYISSLAVTCSEDLPGDLSFQFLHCVERCEDDAPHLEPGTEAMVSTYSRKIITLFHESDIKWVNVTSYFIY